MKRLSLVLLVGLLAGAAAGDLEVNFSNSGGVVETSAGSGIYIQNIKTQLIWSLVDPTLARAGIGGTLAANEYLLLEVPTTDAWGIFNLGLSTYVDSNVGNNDINSGYFFVRMFDTAAIGEGDFYLQQWVNGPSLSDSAGEPKPPAYISNTKIGGTTIDGTGHQVIPEPTVAAFIGVFGAGLIVTRRIFGSKES